MDSRYKNRSMHGRGATFSPGGRFESRCSEAVDDGWGSLGEPLPPLTTEVRLDAARSIISRNNSPDIPFSQSINPYRGCEHGCVYCYARPTHAYLGLSPGLEFETVLYQKADAAMLLRTELTRASYRCSPITLGANTDAYQPIERRLRITRDVLQVLHDCNHPVTIITKSALVERDIDLLAPMAARGLAKVLVSITTLQSDLARVMEPRAATPLRRMAAIKTLAASGIPVGVLVAPVIPGLTDAELEAILMRAKEAGASSTGYVFLRLPLELAEVFDAWLREHFPASAERVWSLIRASRDGRDNVSKFGERMRGSGVFADLIAQRFRLASSRLGLAARSEGLDCSQFVAPEVPGKAQQLELFAE